MSHSQPNILMIMADQLSAKWLGAYGHPLVRSPHIDALAARGVRFDAAYTNCPICAPSRASMCTGRYVSGIDAFDNGSELPASTPTFMHHLKRAGYRTWLSGKMHFIGPDQHHGFDRRLTPEIYPSGFNWTPDWRESPCPNPGSAVDQLRDSGVCDWSLQLDYDEEVHARSLGALRDLTRLRGDNKPFFLCASYTHPHDPFCITRKWWDLYDHDTLDDPQPPGGPIEDMHPYDQWLQIHHMVDRYPPTGEQIRNTRHAYYGMVSYFDSKVGELVAELERLGLADNTVVIVTSDHGEMLGEHGMWFKRTCYDASVRVPLIVAGTERVADGRSIDRSVSLVDLFPTLLDWADLDGADEVGEPLDGHSLVGLISGDNDSWDRPVIGEYCSEGVCAPIRMAVRDQLKYIYVHGQAPQLYDLAVDPHETDNKFDDPAYTDRLAELKHAVHDGWDPEVITARVLASQRDRRYINASEPVETRRAWDAQPDIDAREQYVRKQNAQVTNERRRYPRTSSD
ncbi:MAG: choline-sulfatase [Planctomycetota bacterium]|jgi:choline-sulfatase